MSSLARLDLVEVAATVYDKLLDGESDTDIMTALRLDAKTYEEIKKFLFESKAEKRRAASRERTFAEYETAQRAIIKQLDKYVGKMDDMKMLGSVVGALRLRSDIEERIIDRGFELGIFRKTAERKELVAGIVVADMSTSDLTKAITKHHKTVEDMIKRYGDKDFLSLPSKPLHYGAAAFDTTGETVEEDDEHLLKPKAEKAERKSKRAGGRSGKHAGYRERSTAE